MKISSQKRCQGASLIHNLEVGFSAPNCLPSITFSGSIFEGFVGQIFEVFLAQFLKVRFVCSFYSELK